MILPSSPLLGRMTYCTISIPTHVFYENHGIPENRVGCIHSKWKDFRDFQKFHLSGNPSPSLTLAPDLDQIGTRSDFYTGFRHGLLYRIPSRFSIEDTVADFYTEFLREDITTGKAIRPPKAKSLNKQNLQLCLEMLRTKRESVRKSHAVAPNIYCSNPRTSLTAK